MKRSNTLNLIKKWLLRGLLLIAIWLALVSCVVVFAGRSDDRSPADIIVIAALSIHRVERAAELWHAGVAPKILCTGGDSGLGMSFARICQQWLLRYNVPENVVVLEEHSLSTEEHALYMLPLIQEYHWQRVLVVSDSCHLLRLQLIYQHYGIPITVSGVPNLALGAVVRESLAITWLLFKWALGLPFTRIDSL